MPIQLNLEMCCLTKIESLGIFPKVLKVTGLINMDAVSGSAQMAYAQGFNELPLSLFYIETKPLYLLYF